ncbi:hypothetical protein ABZ635_14845 [Nocardiopsis sp. NPDC007018]|uniref:hypothetical protein n=1 Tax=Nocardiopsis sp. NPDC007018 TaxID=3155721 RepID=UPI0033D7B227
MRRFEVPSVLGPVLALVLALVLTAAPAAASPDDTAPENASEAIAASLAESPVHVDPAYSGAFPEELRQETVDLIEDSGLPLYVVAVPMVAGDAWDGEPENLAVLLHDRMGGGRAHFLVFANDRVYGQDFGAGSDLRAHYGSLTSSYATGFGGNIAELIEVSVEASLSEDPEAAYTAASEAYDEQREDGSAFGSGAWRGGATAVPGWVWPSVAAVALLLAVGAGWRAYRARVPALPALAVTQHAGFDNADRAELDRLVERGATDLVELGERLGQLRARPQGEEATRLLQYALDARSAAAKVHDHMLATAPTLPDAAGVLVLLDMAEDAIVRSRSRSRPARVHCYANPLHGTVTRETDWREFGGTRTVRVPLCAACAKAVRGRGRPRVLPDRHQGSEVPYYEVPAEASVWAATGYGALRDDLVDRVLRGDHARSRR